MWPGAHADWQALTPGAEARLRAWFDAGHPAIVARGDGEPAGTLRLGVPLPPGEGRHRLALRVRREAVARTAPPPVLEDVVASAPAAMRPALQALWRDAHGFAPRVFGSFAWQAVTGLDYVHAGSDLDLLWPAGDAERIDAIVALLQRWEARHGLRADGELLLPGDVAVNWREYAGTTHRVLVKSHDGCRLLARAQLFAPPCTAPAGTARQGVGTEVPPTGRLP